MTDLAAVTVTDLGVFKATAYVFESFGRFFDLVVSGLQFTQGPSGTSMSLNSNFTLGPGTNGIDPVNEPVRLQLGSLFLTIPPASFHRNKKGNYVFEGVVDGTTIDAQFKVVGANSFQFLFEGRNAPAQTATGPTPVVLSIGDDGGSTTN